MAEADSKPIAQPEELHRFIRAVFAASDSHTLTMMVAYRRGWIDLCRRVLAALAEDSPASDELAAACRKAGILPKRLRQRLEPLADTFRPRPDDDPPQDYFQVLRVSKEATEEEIRRAYRRRARRLHPDQGGDSHAFIELSTAYQTLIDPGQRRLYEAGVLPTEVDWYPPSPPSEQPKPKRTRFPVFMALLVMLLIAVTFGLETLQELSAPARPQRRAQVAVPPDRMPAEALARPEPPNRKAYAPPIENPVTPGPSMPMAGRDDPPEAQERMHADTASDTAMAPAGAVVPAGFRPADKPPSNHTQEHSADAADFPPPSRTPQAASVQASPVDAPAPGVSRPDPLVLVFAPEVDAAAAKGFVAFLNQRGYRLLRPTRKDFAGPSSVRYFHSADRPSAEKLRRAIHGFQPRPPGGGFPGVSLIDLSRRYPAAPRGLIEIWISAPIVPAATPRAPARHGSAIAQGNMALNIDMRLHAFLAAYCRAYESMDVVQLSAFYHEGAQENGRPIEAMLTLYMASMAGIAAVDHRIELDGYQYSGPQDPVQIAGRFFTRTQRPDHTARENHGTIAMELWPRGKSFIIKTLNYADNG